MTNLSVQNDPALSVPHIPRGTWQTRLPAVSVGSSAPLCGTATRHSSVAAPRRLVYRPSEPSRPARVVSRFPWESSPFDGLIISRVRTRVKGFQKVFLRDLLACQRDPPSPRLHPRGHRLLRSPHERLGSRAVDPTRFPSHIAALCPSLDFYQTDGEGLVMGFVAHRVTVPEEERLIDARGEGDLQHLPRLRSSHLPLMVLLYHGLPALSRVFRKFFIGRAGVKPIRLRQSVGSLVFILVDRSLAR